MVAAAAPLKKSLATAIVHSYTHDPYAPVCLRDVEPVEEYTPPPTPIHPSQAQPYSSPALAQTDSPSVQRVVYVNGRPVVLTSQVQMMCAGPADTSVQDISFEDRDDDDHMIMAASGHSLDKENESEDEGEDEVVTIEFHQRRGLKYYCSVPTAVGDFVVVEGDRGYDIGRVTEKTKRSQFVVDPKKPAPLWVLRLASTEEIRVCQTEQVALEEAALNKIRSEIERLHLQMVVTSCEFQYDRQKLSYYFEAKDKVMFVPLLKTLHREFQCRIWLQQVNRNSTTNVN
jgi:hypothetical protein